MIKINNLIPGKRKKKKINYLKIGSYEMRQESSTKNGEFWVILHKCQNEDLRSVKVRFALITDFNISTIINIIIELDYIFIEIFKDIKYVIYLDSN